mgnify:CR=1 FL=1
MEDKNKGATNDGSNLQVDALADLPLTGEQAEDAKAGGRDTEMKDEKIENPTNDNIHPQENTLIDLPLAEYQADETRGGDYTQWRSRFGSGL